MGKDINVHILKYNYETNLYEELKIYRKRTPKDYEYEDSLDGIENNPYYLIRPYTARNQSLFNILLNKNDENKITDDFPCITPCFNSYSAEFNTFLQEKAKTGCYFDFYETTFADVSNYLEQNPTIIDSDIELEDPTLTVVRENPVVEFYESCCAYLTFAEYDSGSSLILSSYKIVYYFDV